MTNDNGRSMEEDIKKMVSETYAMTQENYKLMKKIHKHMVWDQVMSVIKVLLIVVPLIWGYYVLAPYLQQTISTYKSLFGAGTTQTNPASSDVLNNISPEMIKQIQDSGLLEQYLNR